MKRKQVPPTVAPVNEATADDDFTTTPTVAEYLGLQQSYDHFNIELFGVELPNVMIVLTRRAHSAGHFSPDRFVAREGDDRLHEVSLNPDHFHGRTDKDILAVQVHEMVHVLQEVRGTAPKRPYHNKDFAELMKARGLYPSNTGAVGGRETGAQMDHYIIPGGRFEQSYERLHAKGWKLNLQSAMVAGPQGGKKKNKTALTCSYCGANAWGKSSLFSVCGLCLVENHPELMDVAETYRMMESRASAIEPAEPEHSDRDLQAAE
jgi:hypothetical protein